MAQSWEKISHIWIAEQIQLCSQSVMVEKEALGEYEKKTLVSPIPSPKGICFSQSMTG